MGSASPVPVVAWEDQPGVGSWLRTAGHVLTAKATTLRALRISTCAVRPALFAVVGGLVALAGAIRWRLAFWGLMALAGRFEGVEIASDFLVRMPIAVATHVVVVVALSGVLHAALLVLGAGGNGYRGTLRAVLYVAGSCAPMTMLPLAGDAMGLVWAVVVLVPALTLRATMPH